LDTLCGCGFGESLHGMHRSISEILDLTFITEQKRHAFAGDIENKYDIVVCSSKIVVCCFDHHERKMGNLG